MNLWDTKVSRRDFLKAGTALGGGLLLSLSLPGFVITSLAAPASNQPFRPNAFLRITPDGLTTIIVPKSEMGQGVLTALPMLIAEELDADWAAIRVEQAPTAKEYQTTWNLQITGGSTSVRSSWDLFRQAGAAARFLLVAAAAQIWNVAASSCTTQNGIVTGPGGKKLTYGALVDKAAALASTLPKELPLKQPKDFRYIGKPLPRLDVKDKVNGRAAFGIDVQLPGLLIAKVLRCPVFGGKLVSFNATKAKAVPGVRHVVQISQGVAIVADHYWAAVQGIEALECQWDEGPNKNLSSDEITRQFAAAAQKPGEVARQEGHADKTLLVAKKQLKAIYQVPFLHHATMEPQNCTAYFKDNHCEIWAPTQSQTNAQKVAAKAAGLPIEAITLHTTLLGGGFGRRLEHDFVAEAVEIAKAVKVPIKVVWSREEDVQHGFYRPATYNVLQAGLDERGQLQAWTHRIVGPSIAARSSPDRKGIDHNSVDGAADLPYDVPNLLVDYIMYNTAVPVGYWRSVGSSQNAFITECFLDEVAAASGQHPYTFRLKLLAKAPRHKAVLELAATQAKWQQPLPKGHALGFAVHQSFGSYVAHVAEVSVVEGEVRVHRVVCAIDCGMVVNPDIVTAQMQSGVVFGLTAALKGEITLEKGRVQQSNFHDYPLLRMSEMPVIEVHIMPSADAPGGVGEPGVPPIAPAVANAVFAVTGKRIRQLPIKLV